MTDETTRRRVAVLGHRGRMGSLACATLAAADDLDLVAGLGRDDDLERLREVGAEVVVDLTRPDVVLDHLRFAVRHGLDCVVGTSGVGEKELAAIRAELADAPGPSVLIVPNFAIGAVLAARFARLAAPFFASAEIIEVHHPAKVDAPSGTAAAVARAMGRAREEAGIPPMPDATASDPLGARGARIDGVPVHAVRMSGTVARLEVMLGNAGETLRISHDSSARESFMPGLLAAVRAVGRHPGARGLAVGLEDVLLG